MSEHSSAKSPLKGYIAVWIALLAGTGFAGAADCCVPDRNEAIQGSCHHAPAQRTPCHPVRVSACPDFACESRFSTVLNPVIATYPAPGREFPAVLAFDNNLFRMRSNGNPARAGTTAASLVSEKLFLRNRVLLI